MDSPFQDQLSDDLEDDFSDEVDQTTGCYVVSSDESPDTSDLDFITDNEDPDSEDSDNCIVSEVNIITGGRKRIRHILKHNTIDSDDQLDENYEPSVAMESDSLSDEDSTHE